MHSKKLEGSLHEVAATEGQNVHVGRMVLISNKQCCATCEMAVPAAHCTSKHAAAHNGKHQPFHDATAEIQWVPNNQEFTMQENEE
jgi:hypothetical protein